MENAEEWMGYLRLKANECEYKEKDRRLKEQFINGINDDEMKTEIIWELNAVKKTSEITSTQELAWARRLEAERTQKALMEATKDNRF